MSESKLATLLQACIAHISYLHDDPSAEIYVTTEFEGDHAFRCLHCEVAGVPVLRMAVRKEEDGRAEDVSFALSESPGEMKYSESSLSGNESIGQETEGKLKSRKTYREVCISPFQHKPDFSRERAKPQGWQRSLTISIPDDPYPASFPIPSCEENVQVPRASQPSWSQGTKRTYEDSLLLASAND